TRNAIRNLVRRGILHPVHRGVYAVGHTALSPEGVWLAAVRSAGPHARLTGISLALLYRLCRRREHGCDVLVPGGRTHQRDGVRIHACNRLDPRDLTEYRAIPVTTIPRLLVDLTDVLTPEELANLMHEAAYQDRLNPRAIRAAAQRANGKRHLDVLHAALELHEHGSAGLRSQLEGRLLNDARNAGLPEPQINVKVTLGAVQIEVDFLWEQLVVEVDGPGHRRVRTRENDQRRDVLLREGGYQVLHMTAEEIRQGCIPRLRRALAKDT
ncbi:MAG TPA: DUF559 domain-containing protein, partial [Solirubrobacteraceae bacterium]|nr:DUF559 domain-containing protein [Solirubrobacteraceae bacterium]